MKLLVATNQEVVRAGVAAMLKRPIVSSSTEDALKAIAKHKPTVVLLAMNGEGFKTLESIRAEHPSLPVVAFSSSDDKQLIARAVRLGVADYVLKTAKPTELSKAIERAAEGQPSGNPLMEVSWRRKEPSDRPLTDREIEVVKLLTLGKSNREIGKELRISVETVKEHMQNIIRKLRVGDRTEAAIWAVRQGLA